jgi:hypothetical protein
MAEASDPFRDPKDPLEPKAKKFHFENDSDGARLVCGQPASYVAAHTGSQFRVYLYAESSRFICWDRDGAAVTRRSNYIKHRGILAQFFWHYTHLDHRQHGYPISVLPASSVDLQQIQHVKKSSRDENPTDTSAWNGVQLVQMLLLIGWRVPSMQH